MDAHVGAGLRPGVLGGVGQRLGDHEVGRRLHHRRRAASDLRVDRGADRGRPRDRLGGGGQAAVGQHRRGDASREVAQLGDRRLPRRAPRGRARPPRGCRSSRASARPSCMVSATRRACAPSCRSRSIRRSSWACTSSAPRRVRVSSSTRSTSSGSPPVRPATIACTPSSIARQTTGSWAKLVAARHRPGEDQRRGIQAKSAAWTANLRQRPPDVEGAEQGGVETERDREAVPDPHRPERAAAGHQPKAPSRRRRRAREGRAWTAACRLVATGAIAR